MVVAGDVLSQLRRGALEFCVLALLADEKRYGFDIVKTLCTFPGMVTGEGTVYPLLSRLNKAGQIESSWQDSIAGPPRKYYAITRSGKRALEDFRSEWQQFSKTVDTILLGESR